MIYEIALSAACVVLAIVMALFLRLENKEKTWNEILTALDNLFKKYDNPILNSCIKQFVKIQIILKPRSFRITYVFFSKSELEKAYNLIGHELIRMHDNNELHNAYMNFLSDLLDIESKYKNWFNVYGVNGLELRLNLPQYVWSFNTKQRKYLEATKNGNNTL
jgi:hypothetical protein